MTPALNSEERKAMSSRLASAFVRLQGLNVKPIAGPGKRKAISVEFRYYYCCRVFRLGKFLNLSNSQWQTDLQALANGGSFPNLVASSASLRT